ncbi:MAG: hypothetical protein M1836_003271 [Candelina mexicana]|nr:MAG: hypothetical protein M1836_003271 [Candelina mexicana]
MRDFYEKKQAFRIYHGSTNSTRPISFQQDKMIDTSTLTHVLKVDNNSRTVLVEPNVPMDLLVKATIPYGLLPPVVMEFPGITVGGGFAGTSGESSSFKYGFFHHTVNWVELVLPNGDIVNISETNLPDLFHGAAGSFGTLGVTTLLELQLIEATKYVELTYHPVTSVEAAVYKLRSAAQDTSIDYLDGILFSLDRGVILTGRLTNSRHADWKIQRFSHSTDPWFYLHAQKTFIESMDSSKPGASITEAIPLVDYLFRYDRGGFWVGYYAFKYFVTPFNRITRWLLDPFMHTRVMYHALHESGHAHRYIIQDLALPQSTAKTFIEYVDEAFGIYPLWLCPVRQTEADQLSLHPYTLPADTKKELLINVGLWGPGPIRHDRFVEVNRELEHKVHELSGMKWLYAHAYYTESEFWSIYDRKWYDSLRSKYGAQHLPSVYDKVTVDTVASKKAISGIWGIWPMSGLYGVARATISKNYLLSSERLSYQAWGLMIAFIQLIVAIIYKLLPFQSAKITDEDKKSD